MLTNRFRLEIDVDASCDRIGDDQQRRGQIVGPRVRMNTAFEISVAGQYSAANQVVLECSTHVIVKNKKKKIRRNIYFRYRKT